MKNKQKISNAELALLVEKGAIIIDLRKRQEYLKSHVQGAVNLNFKNLEVEIEALKKEQNPIVFYSHSGKRSKEAIERLIDTDLELYDVGSLKDIDLPLISKSSHDSYGQRNIGDFFR